MEENNDFITKWNALFKKAKGSVYQSIEWALAKKDAIYVYIEDEGELKAGILAFVKKKKFPLVGTKSILAAEGTPLFVDGKYSIEILNKFREECKKHYYGLVAPTHINYNAGDFEKCKYKKISNNTVLIDLNKSEEEIWQNLEKKSIRWGVNYASKQGLSFEKCESEKDAKIFYKLYLQTAHEGDFPAETEHFIESVMKSGIGSLFLVKKEQEIVCGGLVIYDIHKEYAILNLTSSSAEGLKLQAMPFLYWNMILESKSRKLSFFDLGGYDNEAKKDSKMHNINKFKERFGGKVVDYPIYSPSSKYSILRKVYKIWKNIK